jgi:flavin reductase (DIM6/NTAB) family NADH-FMN oxidoreductase RutF
MVFDPGEMEQAEVYKLMIGTIVPRPIAFISSLNTEGQANLAPFSFFNGVTSKPALVTTSIIRRKGEKKDTARNILDTKEYVINVVTEEILAQCNLASGDWPPEVDEFDVTGLTKVPSDLVKPPGVAESPIRMECRLYDWKEYGDAPQSAFLFVGEVLRWHIANEVMDGTRVDAKKVGFVGRLGGPLYATLGEILRHERPKQSPD